MVYWTLMALIPAIQTKGQDTEWPVFAFAQGQKEADKAVVWHIYEWVGQHIEYSGTTYNRSDNTTWQEAETVLDTRQAVCIGFARLFQALCERSGIRSFVVEGYTSGHAETQHAWNVVFLSDRWYPLDITWDADRIKNGLPCRYFLADPADFIHTHYPNDPLWQLTDHPVHFEAFRKKMYAKAPDTTFLYQDSIAHWLTLPENERLKASLQRSIAYHPDNKRVIKDLANYYYEKAVEVYHRIEPIPVHTTLPEDAAQSLLQQRKEQTKLLFQMSKQLFEKIIAMENVKGMTDSKINLAMIEDNLRALESEH